LSSTCFVSGQICTWLSSPVEIIMPDRHMHMHVFMYMEYCIFLVNFLKWKYLYFYSLKDQKKSYGSANFSMKLEKAS
jgi:hypothetical protein